MKNAHNTAISAKLKLLALAIGLSLSGVVLTGCGTEAEAPVVQPSVKPALIETITASRGDNLSFNGVVRAAERADLSFRVGGRLTDILVKEGDRVSQGQLLARLDSRDAEIALASARLELNNIEAEYQRAKAIYEKSKAISKSSLDELTTRFNLAQNRRDEAQRQLDYTRIEAPFDGIIGRKLVDNHMQIQANAVVFTLHDLNDMEVVIHIPDSVMLSGLRSTKAAAELSTIPNQLFDLNLRSYATQADPISQTYAVVLGFENLNGYRVLPGMTVKVLPAEQENNIDNPLITLPITAVVPDNQGKQFVWLVGSDNKVTKRFVEVGALSRDRVVISAHLALGERVVIAGVSSLQEGMEIRPMDDDKSGSNEAR
ncbi:efflux RND transporter periplasmic adaptor subunit [Vibrio renipiscarius]|uniref:Hemolysin secretion protein D n=1 Tax=Vibrio renipiscarius TaxID=1461322 RepID=A0A0C2NJH1_9VIBR|nr:efflux RND transporter periplasmic adaptor subunit [Vibrio renipiscarius]KII79626.1 hemolysin secretion protein D [Vibrio renipiscarius]KII80746.1 hemolysin secretion protein D [Vibrio renipiscarius]